LRNNLNVKGCGIVAAAPSVTYIRGKRLRRRRRRRSKRRGGGGGGLVGGGGFIRIQ
jgi:hypothetical protein